MSDDSLILPAFHRMNLRHFTEPKLKVINMPVPFDKTPYVSIYGPESVKNVDKTNVASKIGSMPLEFKTSVFRLIQIWEYNNGHRVSSLKTFYEKEIVPADIPASLVSPLHDFITMTGKDKPRAQFIRKVLGDLTQDNGFHEFDLIQGKFAKRPNTERGPFSRGNSPTPSEFSHTSTWTDDSWYSVADEDQFAAAMSAFQKHMRG